MKNQKVWDVYVGDLVEMPEEMQAFLTDIEVVCREHGLSLAHEDEQGGFLVEELNERNLRWVAGAAKRYTRMIQPAGGPVHRQN